MCRSCLSIIPTYRKTDARHAFGNASCGMNTNRHTKSCPKNSCSDTVQESLRTKWWSLSAMPGVQRLNERELDCLPFSAPLLLLLPLAAPAYECCFDNLPHKRSTSVQEAVLCFCFTLGLHLQNTLFVCSKILSD